jgi:hypothetical protein
LLIDASTKQPFTSKDPCVELNPHVGFDPAATEAAKISVKEFLKKAFKLWSGKMGVRVYARSVMRDAREGKDEEVRFSVRRRRNDRKCS